MDFIRSGNGEYGIWNSEWGMADLFNFKNKSL